MGYERHHAIIVTGMYDDWIDRAHDVAWKALVAERSPASGILSPISDEATNGARSFCLFPDGSKEGWATSDDGDRVRNKLVAWLESIRYEDGSSPLAWVEVQYGDDDMVTVVCRDSDAEARRRYAMEAADV